LKPPGAPSHLKPAHFPNPQWIPRQRPNPVATIEQLPRDVPADETGCSRNESRLHLTQKPAQRLERIAEFRIDSVSGRRLISAMHHAMLAARIVPGPV